MIALSIFNTVEFYVIAVTVAAAIVAASAIPTRRGAARTFLFSGTLYDDGNGVSEATINVRVTEQGQLEIRRSGLLGMSTADAYSLAVQIVGFDVTINERLTPGRVMVGQDVEPADAAVAVLDCFGRERYHFQYISEATKSKCAFTLNIAPGNKIHRELTV